VHDQLIAISEFAAFTFIEVAAKFVRSSCLQLAVDEGIDQFSRCMAAHLRTSVVETPDCLSLGHRQDR
jgi:hypothetical protein